MGNIDLVGVRGWLLLLVIWLSVASIIGALTSYSQFWIAEMETHYIVTLRSYKIYKSVFFAIVMASVGIKLYAAFKLYTQHEKSSVKFAKYTLWLAGPIASALIAFFSLKLNYAPLLGENIKYTFVNVIFALIWTLYLNNSDRVYNTYSISSKKQLSLNSHVNEICLNTINKSPSSIPKIKHIDPAYTQDQPVDNQGAASMNNNEYSEVINEDKESNSEKTMNNNNFVELPEIINEDELYLQATREVDEENQDQALWAKCMALCEGDAKKAKYKYIKERVFKLDIIHKNLLNKQNEQKKRTSYRS